MQQTVHSEKHFLASKMLRDGILGMSDGLTVPFALAAGLTAAVAHSSIIIVAGLAELVAGAISMGLGGYMAAQNEVDHYAAERAREYLEVTQLPNKEKEEVREILGAYGLTAVQTQPIIDAFVKNPDSWVDFMMRYELNLEKPDKKRVSQSAITIALSYAVGGIIPLAPYMFYTDPHAAFLFSILVTLCALFVFGYIKSRLVGIRPFQGAFRTVLIGGIAATAAYCIARLIAQ